MMFNPIIEYAKLDELIKREQGRFAVMSTDDLGDIMKAEVEAEPYMRNRLIDFSSTLFSLMGYAKAHNGKVPMLDISEKRRYDALMARYFAWQRWGKESEDDARLEKILDYRKPKGFKEHVKFYFLGVHPRRG